MNELLVNIDVPDLKAAIRFYVSGLGFELRRRLFEGSVAELVLSGSTVYLIEHQAGTEPVPGLRCLRNYERHWTPVHLDVVVEDLDEALRKAVAAGAVLSGDPASRPWGRSAPLSDPFGHGFCLLEFSKAGYGAVAD